jgi:hypothetical protein
MSAWTDIASNQDTAEAAPTVVIRAADRTALPAAALTHAG